MISQSFLLLKIQLLKGFGINEAIHCRDARKKRRLILLLSVYILLGIMLVFYTAGAAFMLCAAGGGRQCSRVCGGCFQSCHICVYPVQGRSGFICRRGL